MERKKCPEKCKKETGIKKWWCCLAGWIKGLIIFFAVAIAIIIILIIIDAATGDIGILPSNKKKDTKNSGLFVFSILDNGKGYLVPIYVSTKESENNQNASLWDGVGKKMGIQPRFEDNTFKVDFDTGVASKIRSITFISSPTTGVVPQDTAISNLVQYNYLFVTGINTNTMPLYELGKGISIVGQTDIVQESDYGYNGLLDMAYDSLEMNNFCTPRNSPSNCNTNIPHNF